VPAVSCRDIGPSAGVGFLWQWATGAKAGFYALRHGTFQNLPRSLARCDISCRPVLLITDSDNFPRSLIASSARSGYLNSQPYTSRNKTYLHLEGLIFVWGDVVKVAQL